MYRSRKATAVFQHTNPLREERLMKEWQVPKWSSLTKGIYSVQYFQEWWVHQSLGFSFCFYSRTNQGEKGTARFQCCCQGAGALTQSRVQGQPRRHHTACNTSCLNVTGHSLELCQTNAGSGSPALHYWEALVYHLSKNFSMYSSARLQSLH